MIDCSLTRQIKIDLITDTPNAIVSWFEDLCSNIRVIETDIYHIYGGEYIYYTIDKEILFYRNDRLGAFSCSNDLYWNILSSEFNIKYDNIEEITKLLIERIFQFKISMAIRSDFDNYINLIID